MLAFQLQDFIETGHQHGGLVDEPTKALIKSITETTFRPPRPFVSLTRGTSTSQAAIQQLYPEEWAVDKPLFRKTLKQLKQSLPEQPEQPQTSPATSLASAFSQINLGTGVGLTASSERSRQEHTTPPTERADPEFHTPPSTGATPPGPRKTVNDVARAAKAAGTTNQAADPATEAGTDPVMAVSFTNDQFQQLLDTLRHQGQTSQPPAQVTFNPNDRFRARDLGYFEPDDNASKPVESQDGKTVYHNVFSFTSRLRVKATGNEAATIAKNLDQCLLGKAERWYTEELSDVTRAGLQTGVELWCKELEARFREAPGVALSKLEALRYTVQDVRARKDPEEYVQQIILNGKNAGTATTEAAQVMMAYNHMDVQLRVLLAQPTADATISSFLKYVQAAKPNWFDLYQPFTRNNKEFAGTTRHDRHQVSAGQTRQTPVWIW